MRLSTLVVDQGQSKLGVHRDPPGPLYAMIAGPGNYAWNGSEWQQVMQGARLILVDGWFDISYGPRDLVFLDGNYSILPGKIYVWVSCTCFVCFCTSLDGTEWDSRSSNRYEKLVALALSINEMK